jgi:hypothetical protein
LPPYLPRIVPVLVAEDPDYLPLFVGDEDQMENQEEEDRAVKKSRFP